MSAIVEEGVRRNKSGWATLIETTVSAVVRGANNWQGCGDKWWMVDRTDERCHGSEQEGWELNMDTQLELKL